MPKNFKFQISNNKQIPMTQISNNKPKFGYWNLELIWNLVLGVWDLFGIWCL